MKMKTYDEIFQQHKEEIIYLYQNTPLPIREIAERYQMSKEALRRRLKKAGILQRPRRVKCPYCNQPIYIHYYNYHLYHHHRPNKIICPRCGSDYVISNCTKTKICYYCKVCKKHFNPNSLKYRRNEEVIKYIHRLRKRNISFKRIQQLVKQKFNIDVCKATIYNWLKKYTSYKPKKKIRRYTKEEIEYIIKNKDKPVKEVARKLKRPYGSVLDMRYKLRKKGLL